MLVGAAATPRQVHARVDIPCASADLADAIARATRPIDGACAVGVHQPFTLTRWIVCKHDKSLPYKLQQEEVVVEVIGLVKPTPSLAAVATGKQYCSPLACLRVLSRSVICRKPQACCDIESGPRLEIQHFNRGIQSWVHSAPDDTWTTAGHSAQVGVGGDAKASSLDGGATM